MTRSTREVNLSTRAARDRLKPSGKPYFRTLDEGLHLGYRKGSRASAWVVRWYVGGKDYRVESLDGRPDDKLEADGETILNWTQAQATARKHFQRVQREAVGLEADAPKAAPYTVKDAVDDYLAAVKAGRTKGGGKGEKTARVAVDAHIIPELGKALMSRLTKKRVQDWHAAIAASAPRLRTKPGDKQKFREVSDGAETQRRRKSSANRVLTILKAALNHAHQEGKVASDDVWRSVKPFKEVDAARVRYLNDDEARRLVNASTPEFRPLVQAALLTGCRLGELTALVVSDFNADAGTLHIRISKSGKPRHVVLTDEGKDFFVAAITGKATNALVFTKPSEPLANIAKLTGLDYDRITGLHANAFAETTGDFTLDVGGRTIELSPIAGRAIKRMTEGRDSEDYLVPAPHFVPWGKSHQQRPFKLAVAATKIPDLAFHELRHTYASRLVMKGVPLMVVAKQLGHTDTRMVEKHYGHLAPSYVADTVRAAFTHMGIVEKSNVVPIHHGNG